MSQEAVHITEGHVLRREFTLWSSFAFAFAFISPIVALYGIFGLALMAAGPSFWWGFLLVFTGQLLVAFVFAMLVSRWPIEGSIYQWSRRLIGTSYGWFAGWAYMWTLVIAMAVALGAAGFVANIMGNPDPTGTERAMIAFVILLLGTAVNLVGRQALKIFMSASIIAEVVAPSASERLLLFHRENSLSVLTQGGESRPRYLSLSGPFLVAVAFIGWSFVGFESAGAIAEEVHEPRKNLPKSVIFSLTFIAIVVMYSSLAIILAIPDLDAVAAGDVADPVYETLTSALGAGIAKPVELLFVIGFLASFLALQTSASRVIWSYARDGGLPARVLGRLSKGARIPTSAILVTTVIGAGLFLLSNVASNIYTLMVNFTTAASTSPSSSPWSVPVVQVRGRWHRPLHARRHVAARHRRRHPLGRAGVPQHLLAAPVYERRFLDWSVWIVVGVLEVVGAAIFATVRSRILDAHVIDVEEAEDEREDLARGAL